MSIVVLVARVPETFWRLGGVPGALELPKIRDVMKYPYAFRRDSPSFHPAPSTRIPVRGKYIGEPVDPDDLKLDEKADFDAYLLPAERGSIQTLLHPSFSVVVPQPDPIRFPLAYPLARQDREWAQVVDVWIEGERKAGNLDALYRHWILGQSAASAGKRWSILKDVLHLGERLPR